MQVYAQIETNVKMHIFEKNVESKKCICVKAWEYGAIVQSLVFPHSSNLVENCIGSVYISDIRL
jgi:hypothetical protein